MAALDHQVGDFIRQMKLTAIFIGNWMRAGWRIALFFHILRLWDLKLECVVEMRWPRKGTPLSRCWYSFTHLLFWVLEVGFALWSVNSLSDLFKGNQNFGCATVYPTQKRGEEHGYVDNRTKSATNFNAALVRQDGDKIASWRQSAFS